MRNGVGLERCFRFHGRYTAVSNSLTWKGQSVTELVRTQDGLERESWGSSRCDDAGMRVDPTATKDHRANPAAAFFNAAIIPSISGDFLPCHRAPKVTRSNSGNGNTRTSGCSFSSGRCTITPMP